MSLRRCPMCHRGAYRTMRDNIAGHLDSLGRPCPASGEPYETAAVEWDDTRSQWVHVNDQEPA